MIIKQIIFQQPEANGYISTATGNALIAHSSLAYPAPGENDIVLQNAIVDGTEILNIYRNILKENEICDKLGIVAPPGTKFLLSDNKQNSKMISIGATGLYELEGIKLTEIKAIPITQYTYKAETTAEYLANGKKGLIDALSDFYGVLTDNHIPADENATTVSQQNLDNIHQGLLNFEELYTNNYTIYQVGLNGVYEKNKTAFLPQTSIIIDYRVEEAKSE